MRRPESKWWQHATRVRGKNWWKCKHCKTAYAGGVTRIEHHINGTGSDIKKCSNYVDNEVGGDHNIIASGSGNPQEAETGNTLHPVPGSAAEEIEVESGNVNDSLKTEMSELNKLVSDLISVEKDIELLMSRGKKRKAKVDTWLDKLQDLKKSAVDINNSFNQFCPTVFDDVQHDEVAALRQDEMQRLIEDMREHKEEKPVVLSNEFVGKGFESNVKKMWSLVEDEQVFIIGIQGMGGVGKTFLAAYMQNEIKRKSTFKDVFWITVSHDFTIFKLQHDIAETIGIKLYEDDETSRATILESELEKREKIVLILDDVWEYIDLQKVGIPLRVDGIKLIFTTRLKHVCGEMNCLSITIHTLEQDLREDWELFLVELGHDGIPATLSRGVEKIASDIVNRCGGLPLGICAMAETMTGIDDDIRPWRCALDGLEILKMGGEVLTVLKRSYDNLIEKKLQNCFLHCALLPHRIKKSDLIMKLVESGLVNGEGSCGLGKIFDDGHVIVDKLIDHSLLFMHCDGYIGMQRLLRKMTCLILNESQNKVMAKCGEDLRKIPHMKEWTIDLEAVSLAGNLIEKIQEGASPNCPHLSTLILSWNSITSISECFFTQMNALTLLDLSFNLELKSLPNSLSDLRCLVSLVLRGCSRLEYIPPLGGLQALSRLDVSRCGGMHQVPQGLEKLTNLKWLDMSRDMYSTLIQLPESVLAGLTNMEYLDLRGCSAIRFEDVQGMHMLQYFAGTFLDFDDYQRYVREFLDAASGPQSYFINLDSDGHLECDDDFVDGEDNDDEDCIKFNHGCLRFGNCKKMPYLLPSDLGKLFIVRNDQSVDLCGAFSSNASSLRMIGISHCEKMERLFCLSDSCSSCTSIQNVESLFLFGLKSLTSICKEDADFTRSVPQKRLFSHLTDFKIINCHHIETLLSPRLVAQLQNLEFMEVSYCNSVEEIFAVTGNDDGNSDIILSKLTRLKLFHLRNLKTVCKGTLLCKSEDLFDINYCPPQLVLPTTRCV